VDRDEIHSALLTRNDPQQIDGCSQSNREVIVLRALNELEDTNITVSGLDLFERCVIIDQKPLGRTPRSDVSTYLDLFTHLRQFFASLPAAKALGLTPSHFSTFHRRGMCKECSGMGTKKIDMHFLPSVRMLCTACQGLRLNPASLSVKYKGKNLGQVLRCSAGEARILFEDHWKISRFLDSLIEVGLSYLQLGQEIISLSTGEAQRVRLAKELAKPRKATTLYLMDEPMTGLHMNEVTSVIRHLRKLTEEGHTVFMIEHTLDAIAACDFLLELGPGAGPNGGKEIARGSPQHIARRGKTPTGIYLRARKR
jgi:excinuclease ABC subunit A